MENHEVLEHFVAHLQTITRHIRHASNDPNLQITRVQWLLLRHLRRKGDCTVGQLAEYLNVRSSTMSQMIDRLEKAHLVTREQTIDDARIKKICLTALGEEITRKSESHWIEELSEPFNHFSNEERKQLVTLIKKLVDHLPKKP